MLRRFLDRGTEEHILFSHSRNDTELAPRIYTYLHGKILTQRRKGTQIYLYFCPYVKNRCTQKYTETLLRMLFREGLRRLRETIPLRRVFV
jgi:hypothetical protein